MVYMNPYYMPGMHTMPGMYSMPMAYPAHIMCQIRPVVDYGLREAMKTGKKHAMTEVAIIAYLMGMGYDFYTAHTLAESWEETGTFR